MKKNEVHDVEYINGVPYASGHMTADKRRQAKTDAELLGDMVVDMLQQLPGKHTPTNDCRYYFNPSRIVISELGVEMQIYVADTNGKEWAINKIISVAAYRASGWRGISLEIESMLKELRELNNE